MQSPKEKGHTTKNTKDRATRTSLKTQFRCIQVVRKVKQFLLH